MASRPVPEPHIVPEQRIRYDQSAVRGAAIARHLKWIRREALRIAGSRRAASPLVKRAIERLEEFDVRRFAPSDDEVVRNALRREMVRWFRS